MKRTQYNLPLLLVAGLGVLLIAFVVSFYGDLLGARVIKKGSPRLNVGRGEQVLLELASSPHTRKLEICTEKKNLLLGYSDFSNCRPLKYHVGPNVTKAKVTIPTSFPLERAVVITRLRDGSGQLVPAAPTDEKIALWVTVPRPTTAPVEEESGGGGGGGGSSSGGGGSSSSSSDAGSSNDSTSEEVAEPATVEVELKHVSIDEDDCEVFVAWLPKTVIIETRLAGEEEWRGTWGSAYDDFPDLRSVRVFRPNAHNPAYSPSYPLEPNMDFEFRFRPGSGYEPGDAEPSETYRFNTGPDPAGDFPKCTGGAIFP